MRNFWLIIVGFFVIIIMPIDAIGAEKPIVVLTWKTETYAPAWYTGKTLPTVNSSIRVFASILDGGKFKSVSGETTYWYLDDELLENGSGVQSITFNPIETGEHKIRLQLPNYPGGQIIKTINIPVVDVRVVPQAPWPEGIFSILNPTIKANAFFFNTTKSADLVFNWTVNGQAPKNNANPDMLTINLDPKTIIGTKLEVSLSASNLVRPKEKASKSTGIIFKR
jgi:hypothetical protein